MYTNMVDVFFRALSLVRFSEIWHHNLTEKSAPTIFHISIAEEDDLFSSLVPQAFKRPRLANDFDAANYPCFVPGLEPFLFLQWGFLFFLFYTRGPATNSWLLYDLGEVAVLAVKTDFMQYFSPLLHILEDQLSCRGLTLKMATSAQWL